MNKQTENSPADFSRLTPDHVLGYAETALGRRLSSVCRPLNSYINRVFELQTEEREGVIARFYRPGRWSHAVLLDEHEFLLELAEREIPVVPPLLLENGKTLGEADEIFVLQMVTLYESRYTGWTVKHFYERWQTEHGGRRSYTWTKTRLQAAGRVPRAPRRGAHRKKRPRNPLPGMMLHQDGSTHEWVPGCQWDLIVTMDDATSELYSAFFVEEEGTRSSFHGLREVIEAKGLFSSLYVDRGSHYWYTAEAGGTVDKTRLTQVHRALHQLGITLIAAYSPEARGRSERTFRTLQDRLPKELALAGITDMACP